jgi:lysophospholipase L1-like esterase
MNKTNVSSNDCNGNIDTANAGARMKDLIDDIYNKLPDVTIILSTLVRSRDRKACSEDLSKQYRNLVKNDYRGKRIGMADIESVITMSQVSDDGIHPTDDGYRLFAGVWWSAISKLEGVIQPPPTDGLIKDDSVISTNKCAKVAGNASGPVQTQKGSGHDDGKYVHNRVERGVIESARVHKKEPGDPDSAYSGGSNDGSAPHNIYFANIIKNEPNSDRSQSLDDWIRVIDYTNSIPRKYYFRQNLGGGKFGPSKTFDVGMKCQFGGKWVAFGDFNGDGLDDFFCLGDNSVSVSLNRGGSPPKFESIGVVVPSVPEPWNVHIGDIDGDGRADFCIVADDMSVKCSRNAGQGDKYSWQGFSTVDGLRGQVFGALDSSSRPSDPYFHFGDINGDYRSDIMIVGNNGNVRTWTNRRGRGSGIVPEWSSSGITHEGVTSDPKRQVGHQIKFGKIYGSNRLDYIFIKDEADYFDVVVYENKGSGGTKLKADGTFFCDMRGTGSDDYVWIYADGHSNEIFANTHNPPFWDPNYKFTLKVDAPRTLIHLADWTGNGRCDVLVQDKTTSAVTLWENQWNSATKTLTFANRGVVASPGCGKSTGVSIFDRNMRIADMDGDGRADIVCLELEGKLTSWLNKKEGLENVGQIKKTEGWDRANIRLADVENSGRADIIWLNKYTGAGSVWKNNGYAGPNGGGGGSSFSWTQRGVLYSPIDRGEVMNFANLGGRGRADLVQVYPETNEAYTFFNKCPGDGAGGDDGNISDPKLPVIDDNETPRDDADWPKGFPTADSWLALGDSYSAGVGAGNLLDNPQDSGHYCLTTSGSYPKRLEGSYGALQQRLQFLSCTGDVLANINDAGSHGRASQLELMKDLHTEGYKFATLSIGGNDLGFSSIVASCIIVGSIAGDCEQAFKNAESIAGIAPRDSAAHGEVFAKMQKVYRDILDTAGDDFTLVVTGYARFFAEPQDNPDCNNGQIQLAALQDLPGVETKPSLPLTQELRQRVNRGVSAFNNMIQAAVDEVQQSLKSDNINRKRIKFVDIDPVFEGHRFCQKGSSTESGWPEFTDKAWFFSSPYRSDILPSGTKVVPRTNDGSPKLELDRRDDASCSDPYYQWDCALGKLQARDPGMKLNEKEYPRDFNLMDFLPEATRFKLMKAFHPKTIAYDAIAKTIAQELGESGGVQIPEDPQDPQDTTEYFIWPEDGRDTKQVEEIAFNLQRYITGGSKLEASNTKTLGLNYWRITGLTVDTAMEISNMTNVSLPKGIW